MVREIGKSPYGAAGKVKSLLFPAPRKIRGRSAEDPRRTPAEDMIRGTHAEESSEELDHYQTNLESRRTIRGGSAEATAEDMNS